ncbi:MAG: C40 family peptidase [Eubacterium sp.]|nr:C40 family peptidase [Eubacterium sp.]
MEKSVSIVLSLIIMFSVLFGAQSTASAKEAEKSAQVLSVSNDDIIKFAKKQLGKPYRSCAKGPDAFDCSGLVYYVYGHFGYKMPASSSEYWSNPSSVGKVVATSSTKKAKAGDIISWRNHVAIYTKNGKCIEALNYSRGVIDDFPVEAHASGNGSTYRVIRVKGVKDVQSLKKYYNFNKKSKNVYNVSEKCLTASSKVNSIDAEKSVKKDIDETAVRFTNHSVAPRIESIGFTA